MRGFNVSWWRQVALLAGLCPLMQAGQARAADPQPYTVTIAPTGDAVMDQALSDSSTLRSLQKKAPVGPFALIGRAQADRKRLITAMHSFGYYKASAQVTIDDLPVDDSRLADRLQHEAGSVAVAIKVIPGPLYHIGTLAVDAPKSDPVDAASRAAMGIKAGDPAKAAPILAAGGKLQSALQEEGHALAKISDPVVTENDADKVLNVRFTATPGPRVNIGPITFTGLTDVDPAYIRRHMVLRQGQPDKPSTLEATRQDLAGIGVFSSVQITGADHTDDNGQIPITIHFAQKPPHVVALTGAYSTDLGGSMAVTWSHRNLLGQAEQLNLKAAAIDLGGSSTGGVGYDLDAQFIKPDIWQRDQSLTLNLEGIKQFLLAYNQQAIEASAVLNRKLNPYWTIGGGLQAEQEQIAQEGTTTDYTLVGVPLTVKFDDTNNLLEPTSGVRIAVNATPTVAVAGGGEFNILRVSASTYLDILGDGHSIIALRGTAATVQGEGALAIPPDQRLYAGGSDTIRGYKYQIVGPQFPDANPVGGTQLTAATAELRQHVYGNFGMAVFADAGEVTGSQATVNGARAPDTSGKLAVGAGAGVRYMSPIGPLRVDIALPLVHFPGNDSLEFYIGIGEAF